MEDLINGQRAIYMAPPKVFVDPSWIADSSATNHCTSVSENHQFKSDYGGKEQVHMANSASLNINLVDKALFHSNTHAFYLNDILHMYLITNNLLSVSSFTRDNNCLFEFYPNASM